MPFEKAEFSSSMHKRYKSKADIEDAAEAFKYLSPIDYARLRDIYPQRVYQAIRVKRLNTYWCDCCGNGPLVNVDEADGLFVKKQEV